MMNNMLINFFTYLMKELVIYLLLFVIICIFTLTFLVYHVEARVNNAVAKS